MNTNSMSELELLCLVKFVAEGLCTCRHQGRPYRKPENILLATVILVSNRLGLD
jgi:hypothetical protein